MKKLYKILLDAVAKFAGNRFVISHSTHADTNHDARMCGLIYSHVQACISAGTSSNTRRHAYIYLHLHTSIFADAHKPVLPYAHTNPHVRMLYFQTSIN